MGKAPDYVVKVGLDGAKYPTRVGIAYKHNSGAIEIHLDPCVAIVNSGPKGKIKLMPYQKKDAP